MTRLLSSSAGAATGGTFAHTINAPSGGGRMLLVSIAQWAGANGITGANFNGVPGKLLIATTTAPAFLRVYYWLDAQLPGVGTFNAQPTGPGADAAATSILFGGVDQSNPFAVVYSAYNASSAHPVATSQMSNAMLVCLSALSSASVTPDIPLSTPVSQATGNGKIWSSYALSGMSAPGFSVSGDLRTAIGAVGLRAYEYPKSKARLFVKKLPPALRWWHGA